MKPHSPSGVDALVFSTSDVASEMAATYLRLSSTLKLLLMKLAALEPNSLSLSVAAFFSPKFEHPGEDAQSCDTAQDSLWCHHSPTSRILRSRDLLLMKHIFKIAHECNHFLSESIEDANQRIR